MQDTDIMGDTGVILCDCGCTIKENIDFAKIKEELIKQDHAAVVELCSQFCQQSECSRIVSSLSKKNVKRLVIGACEREIFDKALKEAVQSCNLNQGLLSCINIREHCAWVHPQKEATGKCMDGLIKAIKAIKLAKPYSDLKTMVNQDILVYGGNMAAMETGLALSRMGHNVTLVNSSESLGSSESRTPELYAYLASDAFKATSLIQKRTGALIKSIEDDHKIKVLNNSKIKSIEGELGRFTVIVESTNGEKVVSAGSIVIASDSQTPLEVEFSSLFDLKPFPARIAIVMDVEGQQGKTASAQALSAAELLAKRYKSEIKLFCNNIRVAEEGLEDLYRRARQAGTVIVKYESPPVIRENSNGGAKYLVCLKESITGREMEEEFDHVINADIPFHHNGMLPIINHLRPGPDGELQADSVWLGPGKTNIEGIFALGSELKTDGLKEIQTDGLAAALEIHALLKNREIEVLDDVPEVDSTKCVLCLTCMRLCPHGAVTIDMENESAAMSTLTCKRCGICAALCPAGAIQLPGYTDSQMDLYTGEHTGITVFACENSALKAVLLAGIKGLKYPAKYRLIRVPCAGKVEPGQILKSLESGAERVIILACHKENCRYITGSSMAAKRINALKEKLEKAGFDQERIVFGEVASVEPVKLIDFFKE